MLTILNPVLEIFNLISNAAHYLLVISYLIGKGIYFLLSQICAWIVILYHGAAVVAEELWLFVRELHVSISEMFTYIESSTNHGVGGVLDGFTVFGREMGRFLTNGKMHSKLLASAVGRWIVNFFNVIRGGLLLIADSVWWLVTIIPKTLLNVFIYVGDIVVFTIGGCWKLTLQLAQNAIDELFKYTIAVVVIIILLRNRRRIYSTTRRWTIRVVRTSMRWTVRAFRFFFVLQSNRPPVRSRTISRGHQRSPSYTTVLGKSNELNCCVVCRDRPKCVLLLPCKHLCMCEECAEFILTMRQAFCPLCRSTVHKQLSVYI